uniref:Uncharacterized protein n=1 Tax=Anguilla anguilla TaxID=7936 RepID=A0A0E9WU68_ANGAN
MTFTSSAYKQRSHFKMLGMFGIESQLFCPSYGRNSLDLKFCQIWISKVIKYYLKNGKIVQNVYILHINNENEIQHIGIVGQTSVM